MVGKFSLCILQKTSRGGDLGQNYPHGHQSAGLFQMNGSWESVGLVWF